MVQPQNAREAVPTRQHLCKIYGAATQNTIQENTSPNLSGKGINIVQQVIGVCLYYGRAIDDTILTTLSSIASEQTTATEDIMRKGIHLLDYLATAKNRMGGCFFLGMCAYPGRTKIYLSMEISMCYVEYYGSLYVQQRKQK